MGKEANKAVLSKVLYFSQDNTAMLDFFPIFAWQCLRLATVATSWFSVFFCLQAAVLAPVLSCISGFGWLNNLLGMGFRDGCSGRCLLFLCNSAPCRCQQLPTYVLSGDTPILKTRVASFNHMSTTFTQTSARAVQARLSTFLFLFVRLSPFFLLLSGYPLFDALVCLFV